MTRPRLLDLFCCAGGAGMGYHQAGFDVVGVDINPQPRYPFEFIQADVCDLTDDFLASFDAIHASPPCQAYSMAQRLRKRRHPNLVGELREWLQWIGGLYVIENVVGAPLYEPITLCGAMFGLQTYRHRWFEANFDIAVPDHPPHDHRQTKMGRPPRDGEFIQVVGNFSGVEYARKAMGIDWMIRDELREAIPPAYTKHIGEQLLALVMLERLAA
jgi:DNA (cytosine-5)-methyltransferase 1